MNPATVTLVGRAGRDPELRYTAAGKPVTSLSLATSERRKDPSTGEWGDGPVSWWRVSCWGPLAEQVADQVHKGTALVVIGRIAEREYDKDGETRRAVDVTADTVAVDVRWSKPATRASIGDPAAAGDDWGHPDDTTEAGGLPW